MPDESTPPRPAYLEWRPYPDGRSGDEILDGWMALLEALGLKPISGESLPEMLRRCGKEAARVRASAGITWSHYTITGHEGGFMVIAKHDDGRPPEIWPWPAGDAVELEDVATALAEWEKKE